MLYITTRSNHDAYTAYRTLGQGRGPDGGLFVPFQMPRLDREQIFELREKSFSQNVADILNLFFNARLDSWDVDFCIGRYPAKLVPMSHRIMVAETWHNPDYDFSRVVRNISSRIRGNEDKNGYSTNWAWITTRIATLFALFGELCKLNVCDPDTLIDVALPSGDFAGPMAVWYAREMGLPVGNIICSCDENDAAWDVIHQGELYPNERMNIPSDLERLIYANLGRREAKNFAATMEAWKPYKLEDEQRKKLRNGMFIAVISYERRESIINNVYRTSTYILDPGSAMAYGGLQDYRSGADNTRPALILTERGPICSADTVAKAMNISVEVLKERLNIL